MRMKMKTKRPNVYALSLLVVLLLEHNLYYLIPDNRIFGIVAISDCCVMVELVLFLFTCLNSKLKISRDKYTYLVLGGLLLTITSAIAGFINYGQPFLVGFNVQRLRISSLLFFFALSNWIKSKKITYSEIIKTLYLFCGIYLILAMVQIMVGSSLIFMHATDEGRLRYGSLRFWMSSNILVLYTGYILDEFFVKKSRKTQKVIWLSIVLIFFFFVTKARMAAMALGLSIFICLMIHRGSASAKIIAIVLAVLGLFVLSETPLGMDVLKILGGGTTAGDTLTVRNVGRAYYLGKTFETPASALLGCGYASANNARALASAYPVQFISYYGYNLMLYPDDNGIFGMLYYYGILGLVWWITTLAISFKSGLIIYRKKGSFVYLFLLIYELVTCISLFPTILSASVLAPLLFVLIREEERYCLIEVD